MAERIKEKKESNKEKRKNTSQKGEESSRGERRLYKRGEITRIRQSGIRRKERRTKRRGVERELGREEQEERRDGK